jgi:hypothetical protein
MWCWHCGSLLGPISTWCGSAMVLTATSGLGWILDSHQNQRRRRINV